MPALEPVEVEHHWSRYFVKPKHSWITVENERVYVDPDEKLKVVKYKVCEALGLDVVDVFLLVAGRYLRDDDKRFREFHVRNGTDVEVVTFRGSRVRFRDRFRHRSRAKRITLQVLGEGPPAFSFDVAPSDTLRSVKLVIDKDHAIPYDTIVVYSSTTPVPEDSADWSTLDILDDDLRLWDILDTTSTNFYLRVVPKRSRRLPRGGRDDDDLSHSLL